MEYIRFCRPRLLKLFGLGKTFDLTQTSKSHLTSTSYTKTNHTEASRMHVINTKVSVLMPIYTFCIAIAGRVSVTYSLSDVHARPPTVLCPHTSKCRLQMHKMRAGYNLVICPSHLGIRCESAALKVT